MAKRPKPMVLTVLDGWGYSPETKGNAIYLARKPNYDRLLEEFPNTLIHTSGPYVGLPEGQMGNSEVGHLNIGAGRIVHMDITRIDRMIATGGFARQPLLLEAMHRGRERQLHLLGLMSDGGVHSHLNHLYALLRMAEENRVERVFVHCFMDGRDTPPHSGVDYLRQLEQKMREYGVGRIATVVGRYYAMDRDNRWERIEKAYRAMVHGDAETKSSDPIAAVRASYEKGVTDEFILPVVATTEVAPGKPAVPRGLIRDDDAVIFFNFRADRARQMTRALAEPGFDQFPDPKRPQNLLLVAMTQYEKTWPWLRYILSPEKLEHILANVFAEMQFKNLRCAETEKYAHVTYFFNGGDEAPVSGERRQLVPSPRDVPTYDKRPQMSAREAADAFVAAWREQPPRFGIINFANADMVGHTGVIPAAVAAVEAVDGCLGEVVAAVHESGGACVVTADHGNADHMLEADGSPNTAHSLNPVPLIVTCAAISLRADAGVLADVAPTILEILGIAQPPGMSGRALIGGE
jgi:2,3-bisphosphoglycerate-independent phosphoglycerate mutase